MTGSWFLLREESLEKARERLSRDIYVVGGAWDMSKVSLISLGARISNNFESSLIFAFLQCTITPAAVAAH